MMGHRMPNHCVQATPDCASLFIVAQVCGAPDAERWAVPWLQPDWYLDNQNEDKSIRI